MKASRVERVCQHCGKSFLIRESRLKYGCGKFCSTPCQKESSKNRVQCVCKTCGTSFELARSHFGNRGQGSYCSRGCVPKKSRETNEARFWKYVTRPECPDQCWGWTGATLEFGYGIVRDNNLRRQIAAHRMSYLIHFGDIPEGKFVLHRCDNPPCTNPRHLFLGSKKENSEDMVSKNRSRGGESHFNAKLTEAQILAMRESYASGKRIIDIAEEFSMSRQTVADVVRRRTWKHV